MTGTLAASACRAAAALSPAGPAPGISAYMTDFGLNRAAYIEAFLRNVNWERVELCMR